MLKKETKILFQNSKTLVFVGGGEELVTLALKEFEIKYDKKSVTLIGADFLRI